MHLACWLVGYLFSLPYCTSWSRYGEKASKLCTTDVCMALSDIQLKIGVGLQKNPITRTVSNLYSKFYWLPRRNMPYDQPWTLFRNNTLQFFSWYQIPHNLPPYQYLGTDHPADFFCWGLTGNTLPLGNWDPWGLQQVSKKVVAKYRASEFKHGRIAMLACVGFLVQESVHPLYGGAIGGLAITHMQQLRSAHEQGYLMTVLPLHLTERCKGISIDYWALLCGMGTLEVRSLVRDWVRWKRDEHAHPFAHNIGIGNLRDPPASTITAGVDEDSLYLQNAELNHGRLAMIAFMGMLAQEYLTGLPVLWFLRP